MSTAITRPEFLSQVCKLAGLGLTDAEVGAFFDVCPKTMQRWKARVPGVAEMLEKGRQTADREVEQAIYKRAVGYSFERQNVVIHEGKPVIINTVEYIPPDVGAARWWLGNRAKAQRARSSCGED